MTMETESWMNDEHFVNDRWTHGERTVNALWTVNASEWWTQNCEQWTPDEGTANNRWTKAKMGKKNVSGTVISNSLLRKDRWTEFHETFRNCSLHDAICHTAPPMLSFHSNDFGVYQSKTMTLPYKHGGAGGIILWALLTVFLVY